MHRMLSIAWGAALAVSLAGRSFADDPPRQATYPSSQSSPGGPGSPATGGVAAGIGSPGYDPSQAQAGSSGLGGTNPDGSMSGGPLGDVAGSNAPVGGADGGGAGAGGVSSGLGGFAGGSGTPPGVIGDYQTISRAVAVHSAASGTFPKLPTPVPPPNPGNRNPGLVNGNGTTSILFKLTGLKISDNQSPVPQDRFFYSFNYFDNLNASVDKQIGSPVQNLQVYHQLFGLEKTFLDGRASIGFRVPLNTMSFKSTANIAGLGGSSTSAGDLSIFLKYVLYQREGFLVSTGFQVTPPTGPGGYAGSKYYSYFRDTQIQPFIGYLFTRDRFYLQGFSSISVPSTSQDVTMLFNDVSIGYYAYRAADPGRFLTAIVPTAEAHLNTPLNHRGFSATDLASTPDVLDLTFGTNVEFRKRAILSAAYVTPVTGPKPFNAELVLLLNIRFGGSRQRLSPVTPPVF
jgi:hypothetical protein